uniref:Uncharacterized protein n=1 Tax=Zea mays TaxID=4577 RepID=B4FM16_MAIZE|nr:unknown [Zea mays]
MFWKIAWQSACVVLFAHLHCRG